MAFPEILKEQPENVADLPTAVKMKLINIKQQLETHKEPIAKVALQRLAQATKRADLVREISSIRSEGEYYQLAEGLRMDLSALQAEVETTPEAGKRVTVETANAVMEKAQELHPLAKGALVTGGVVGGSLLIAKIVEKIKNFLIGAKDMALDGGEALVNMGRKGVKGTWGLTKLVFGALGLTAIGKVGYDYFTKKESPETKTA